MEKKENASKLISSLVALSLATTLGVPTIARQTRRGAAKGVRRRARSSKLRKAKTVPRRPRRTATMPETLRAAEPTLPR